MNPALEEKSALKNFRFISTAYRPHIVRVFILTYYGRPSLDFCSCSASISEGSEFPSCVRVKVARALLVLTPLSSLLLTETRCAVAIMVHRFDNILLIWRSHSVRSYPRLFWEGLPMLTLRQVFAAPGFCSIVARLGELLDATFVPPHSRLLESSNRGAAVFITNARCEP